MAGTLDHRRPLRQRYHDRVSVGAQDVQAAAAALAGGIVQTPCLPSRTLSDITGAEVVLKFENHQFTASFKERGALNRLLALAPEERARGVCAPSAGNHAQGVAHHAARLGIPATIVMPRFTPGVKVSQTRALGARVVLHGETFDEARAHAEALVAERGLVLVHPYDDPRVIAGQGTVALEMLAAFPDLDALVVPVGGGGLLAGMAIAARAVKPGHRALRRADHALSGGLPGPAGRGRAAAGGGRADHRRGDRRQAPGRADPGPHPAAGGRS